MKYLQVAHRSQNHQLTSISFSLATTPQVNHDSQGVETYGPLKRNQTPPVPEKLADKGTVSKRGSTQHKDYVEPNTTSGMDDKPNLSYTKPRCFYLSDTITI